MMANSEGKRAAKLIPELSLSDQLSSEPMLDRAIQERIGDHLRAMYDDLMQQPVPDRFVELLNRLEKRNDKREQ
jgi:Anti-sigma factor NepR